MYVEVIKNCLFYKHNKPNNSGYSSKEVSESSSSVAILTPSSLENSMWPDAKQFYSMTP